MSLQFHRPETVEDALALRERLGAAARFLAGGTELNQGPTPIGQHAPHAQQLISLARLQLDRIERDEQQLVIGACCTLQQLVDARELPDAIRAAARQVANRSIRSMATVGGQLAGRRRCSDLVPALVALEATVAVASAGQRRLVPVLEYARADDRPLATHVRLDPPGADRRVAVGRHSRNANGPALVSAAVALSRSGELIVEPIVALGGVAPRVVRLATVESALAGSQLPPPEIIERHVAHALPALADEEGATGLHALLAGVLVAALARQAYEPQVAGR